MQNNILSLMMRPTWQKIFLYMIKREIRLVYYNKGILFHPLLFALSNLFICFFVIKDIDRDYQSHVIFFLLSLIINFSIVLEGNYSLNRDYYRGSLEILLQAGCSFVMIAWCKLALYFIIQILTIVIAVSVFLPFLSLNLFDALVILLPLILLLTTNVFVISLISIKHSKLLLAILTAPLNFSYLLLFTMSIKNKNYLLTMFGIFLILVMPLILCASILLKKIIEEK